MVLPATQNRLIEYVLRTAAGFGVTPGDIASVAGLAPGQVRDGAAMLDARTLGSTLEWLAQRSGRADFGMRIGSEAGPAVLGPLGLLAEHCVSIEELYRALRRYLPLYEFGIRYTLDSGPRGGFLQLHLDIPGSSAARHYVEAGLAMCTRSCQLILGSDWLPERVLLMHSRMAREADYRRVFGAGVTFNAPMHGIGLSAADMQRRTRAADPQLKLMMETYLQEFQSNRHRDRAGRVAELMRALLPTGDASLTRIADILGLNPQTLQRKLRAQGTNYAAVLATTRVALARDYLANSDLPATEIAPLLGFSESSALSRFLRQHTGTTPRAMRRPGNS